MRASVIQKACRLTILANFALFCGVQLVFAQETAFTIPGEKRKEFALAAALPDFSIKVLGYVKTIRDAKDSIIALDDMLTLAQRAGDRVALLREKATILELLGSWKAASSAWSLAYSSAPGTRESLDCLVSASVCLLNIGDSAAVLALTESVKYSGLDEVSENRLKLVSAWAQHMRGNNQSASVLANPSLASENIFLRFQALLLMHSASAGAEKEGFAGQISSMLKNNNELASTFAPYMLSDIATFASTKAIVEPEKTDAKPAAAMSLIDAGEPKFYQVGAFSAEENAKAVLVRLKAAGIAAFLATKKNNSTVLFIVYVESGGDPPRMVLRLKDAGLEAWPLFSAP